MKDRWLLDPRLDWQISKMEIIEQAKDPPTTEAVMHKPMHQLMHRPLAGTPMAHSFLPCPECILEEAWTEGNCIPRQLAALQQVPLSEAEWEIEQ